MNLNSRSGGRRSPVAQGQVTVQPTADDVLVGVDVSKDRLDVAVLPGGEACAVARNLAGIDDLAARLKPLPPRAVALEARGADEGVAVAGLAAVGLPAALVDPAQGRAPAQPLGRRAGTDRIGAPVIARLVQATDPRRHRSGSMRLWHHVGSSEPVDPALQIVHGQALRPAPACDDALC